MFVVVVGALEELPLTAGAASQADRRRKEEDGGGTAAPLKPRQIVDAVNTAEACGDPRCQESGEKEEGSGWGSHGLSAI